MTRRIDVWALTIAYLVERAARSRTVRRLLLAVPAAVAAGTAAVLGLAAAADAWLDSSTPVLLALAAVWISQAITHLARPNRKDQP